MKWDDLRIFITVAHEGGYPAAARALGVNPSTISRRIVALEAQAGGPLFAATGEARRLTAEGQALLDLADGLETRFDAIGRRLAGADRRIAGPLRVTVVDVMVDRYLAPHLAEFAHAHPEVTLAISTGLSASDLSRREADVAIRVSPAPDETLVGRRLSDFAFAVYAAPGADPDRLPWIGATSESYDRNALLARFPEAAPTHRAEGLVALGALVRAGLGRAALPCYWADAEPGLTRLTAPFNPAGVGLWLLTHPDLRDQPRARAFRDFIAARFLADRARFEGRASPVARPQKTQ